MNPAWHCRSCCGVQNNWHTMLKLKRKTEKFFAQNFDFMADLAVFAKSIRR